MSSIERLWPPHQPLTHILLILPFVHSRSRASYSIRRMSTDTYKFQSISIWEKYLSYEVNLIFVKTSFHLFDLSQPMNSCDISHVSLVATALQPLASAFTLLSVDYYNAVLAGLPTSTLAPLQRVLNAAACFVAGATSRAHGNDITKSIRWLPIAYRIRFKLCVLMHGVQNGTRSSYLTDTTTPIS